MPFLLNLVMFGECPGTLYLQPCEYNGYNNRSFTKRNAHVFSALQCSTVTEQPVLVEMWLTKIQVTNKTKCTDTNFKWHNDNESSVTSQCPVVELLICVSTSGCIMLEAWLNGWLCSSFDPSLWSKISNSWRTEDEPYWFWWSPVTFTYPVKYYIATATRWTGTKSVTGHKGAQMINPNDLADSFTFPLVFTFVLCFD